MSSIINIRSFEILDSRGIPTLHTEIELENGVKEQLLFPLEPQLAFTKH